MSAGTIRIDLGPERQVRSVNTGDSLPAGAGREGVAAKKVAREFESMFIGMLLKEMRTTVGADQLTGGGHGEETYRSLLDQEYANIIAQQGGIGIAKIIEQELVKVAPGSSKPITDGMGFGDRRTDNENSE